MGGGGGALSSARLADVPSARPNAQEGAITHAVNWRYIHC